MTERPRRQAVAALALCLLAAACAPSNEVNIGLKDYATDVVYGEPTTTTPPPPPLPEASITPGFPAFIVPPPPPTPPADAPFTTVTAPIELLEDPCPIAGPGSTRIKSGPTVVGLPSNGAYVYRQEGSSKRNGVATTLPPIGERRITKSTSASDGGSWDVVIDELGVKTTTSYRLYRPGESSTDGIYITRVVQEVAGRAPEAFEPIQPGLRILPEETAAGAQWRSVATDVIHGISMILQGTVKEIRQVDICGVIVEGWAADVTLQQRRPGLTSSDEVNTTASYVVASGLGGLIIADSIKQTGTAATVVIDRQTSSVLADLVSR